MDYEKMARISFRNYVAGRSAPVKKWICLPQEMEPCTHIQLEMFLGGDL